jgi:DNA-directed RNA polymerase subunit omega
MKVEVLTAKILDNNPNMDRYQLAIAVAKRTDELLNGATSKLNVSKKIKVADLALMEIAEGLITIKGFVDIKK